MLQPTTQPSTTESPIEDELLQTLHVPSMSDDEIFCRIEAMRRQEEGPYRCSRQRFSSSTHEDANQSSNDLPIDEECRAQMVDWAYQLVDICKIKRENVSIALSHLDRFLQTKDGAKSMKDRNEFQLAAVTSILLAIKTLETEIVTPEFMSDVCQGHHTRDEVQNMELTMLWALQWRMNPPTAISFVHHYLALVLTDGVDTSFGQDLLTFSKFQIEMCIRDYYFVDVKPSLIAYAAILNSLSSLGVESLSSCAHVVDSFRKVEHIRPLASSSKELREVRERLLQTFFDEGAEQLPRPAVKLPRSRSGPGTQKGELEPGIHSPRCIAPNSPSSTFSTFDEAFLCGLLEALAFS